MIKWPNKAIMVVCKAQELLQFFNTSRGGLVFHRLYFLLIYLQFTLIHYISGLFYLRDAKSTFIYFGI